MLRQEVLDRREDAVARASFLERDRERAVAAEAALRELRGPGHATLCVAVRVHCLGGQGVDRVVLVAARARPADVVQDRERLTGRVDRAQLVQDRPVVVVPVDQVGVRRRDALERLRAAALHELEVLGPLVHLAHLVDRVGLDRHEVRALLLCPLSELARHPSRLGPDLHDAPRRDRLEAPEDQLAVLAERVDEDVVAGHMQARSGGGIARIALLRLRPSR